MKKLFVLVVATHIIFVQCKKESELAPIRKDALSPTIVTDKVPNDTDDPAIWINPQKPEESLIIGTDKETNGGLYVFNLQGKIVNKVTGLKRPNNVDIAYGFDWNGKKIDIAVTTERETNKIRIFQLPELAPIDNGGIEVFAGEKDQAPMGVALYTRPSDHAIFAIVGRKSGPKEGYLWQYRLSAENNVVKAEKVRAFGSFSQKKEIEAIAVDNENGYVYYSDEGVGIKKYMADPDLNNNTLLTTFGTKGFKSDHEGIALYKTSEKEGYIIISNQQANTFMIYPREGSKGNPNQHDLIAEVPLSSIECDGADATSVSLGGKFPKGLLVVMSNGKVFQYYDWQIIEKQLKK